MVRKSLKFLFFLSIICFSTIYLFSCLIQFPYDKVETLKGVLKLEAGKTTYLPLPRLRDKDRVMINLQTIATVDIKAVQDGENMTVLPVIVEGAKYNLVDYLLNNQKALFIAKEGNSNYLLLQASFPLTQYHVIFPLEDSEKIEEIEISQIDIDGYRMINVTTTTNTMFAYPLDLTVEDDFNVKFKFLNMSKNIKIKLNLMSDTDNTIYVYEVPENCTRFEINAITEETYKRGTILGDKISSISISMVPTTQNKAASVLLGDLEIINAGEVTTINATAHQIFEVPYEIYIAHKYFPSVTVLILWSFLSFGIIAIWFLINGRPTIDRR